jgi:tetratricopeptide (TPR) repeat protein
VTDTALLDAYERAREQGVAALDAGRLEEALERFDSALAGARALGDDAVVERAFCNRAAVAIALGDVDGPLPELRGILVRNRSAESGFLAAYNIARAYELRKENKKGLFYGRVAHERALTAGRTEWVASATNQIANLQLAESFFGEAASGYRKALALVPAAGGSRHLTYLANLGYCEVVLGRPRAGARLIYRSLREARRHRWLRLQAIAHVDLCYAWLELGDLERARRHGERGLRLAETIGEQDWVKNALYLLGEAAVLAGDTAAGRERFTDLQRRFYPSQPFIPEFLVGVDVRAVVNLRA